MGKRYCRTPLVFQMEATECGAACLAMVCAYWGKHVPLERMRVETGVSRDGCSAGNLMRAAKRLGLECHGYRKEPGQLRGLDFPCVIHWNFNHFVVLEGFQGRHACLNDPAAGRRRITAEELDEGFTGVVLTFRPTPHFEKEKREDALLPLIRARLKGLGPGMAQMICVGLLLTLPGLVVPMLAQLFLDKLLGAGDVSWFGQFLALLGGAALFRTAAALYRARLLEKMHGKLALTSAKEFLDRLFRLPVSFFDQRYAGDLVNRAASNDSVSRFLTGGLAETVLNLFTAAFYLLVLLAYSPVMTLTGALGVAAGLAVVHLTSEHISNLTLKLQQDKGKLAGAVCAGLSVTATLKASGAESAYGARILGYEAKTAAQEQRIGRAQALAGAAPGGIARVTDAVLLAMGGVLVLRGSMTPGMLAAFCALFGSFSAPVEELAGFVREIQILKADMDRAEDIMRHPLDSRFESGPEADMPRAKLSGRVELEDVSFGYSPLGAPLISGLSLSLSPGDCAAFVGASGCGKSTAAKLVSGLYQPWSGSVRLDGVPLSEIPPEVLHASVSTVSQGAALFSGSIRDNLTLWNPAVLEKDIISAAKDACIHDDITQKPGAYDFKLTEGGSNLSGGQRQRLEIARALVTNPTILILDEATSALDPIVEKQILDNIRRRGCTCLMAAHRLSAVRGSGEILVMSAGRVVERGTHEELAAAGGHYRRFMTAG